MSEPSLPFSKEFVLSKCDRFVEMQLWPTNVKIMPQQWLNNFKDSEMECALSLLNSFIYYSDAITDQMFHSAFHGLSAKIFDDIGDGAAADAEWKKFINNSYVTYVSGEAPNPTDSGHLFVRKARQVIGIPERRIVNPENVRKLVSVGQCANIIFVDDFVGSGQQFITSLKRVYIDDDGTEWRLIDVLSTAKCNGYFIPLVCTDVGYSKIKKVCDRMYVSPANVLDSKYSAFDDETYIFPKHLRKSGSDFIYTASLRAGIELTDDFWKGFCQLGLSIAFSHGVPDGTLPLFYWEENGWLPLIRRC